MKNLKMTKNEFAKFLFEIGQNLEHYNSDVFYDIDTIQKFVQQNRNEHEKPVKENYFYFVRDTGTNLIFAKDIESYYFHHLCLNNKDAYFITICANSDYFSPKQTFAQITKFNF